jgi:hypothetical protein
MNTDTNFNIILINIKTIQQMEPIDQIVTRLGDALLQEVDSKEILVMVNGMV